MALNHQSCMIFCIWMIRNTSDHFQVNGWQFFWHKSLLLIIGTGPDAKTTKSMNYRFLKSKNTKFWRIIVTHLDFFRRLNWWGPLVDLKYLRASLLPIFVCACCGLTRKSDCRRKRSIIHGVIEKNVARFFGKAKVSAWDWKCYNVSIIWSMFW